MKTINEIKKIKEVYICPNCNSIFNAEENKKKFTKKDNLVKMILEQTIKKAQRDGDKLR